jgi:hypothetical protein
MSDNNKASTYSRPQPGSPDWFPIIAWGPNESFLPEIQQHHYDEMAECGITVAGFAAGGREELDKVEKAGLVAYVLDRELTTAIRNPEKQYDWKGMVEKIVAEYRNHPANYGYWLPDEPGAWLFPNIAAVANEFRRQDPGKDLYINLYPDCCSDKLYGTAGYGEYLKQYFEQVKPAWLGFDHYSLFEDETVWNQTFWQNLAIAREASREQGIPFYYCTLSVGHLRYRIPSEDDLFFEISAAMLYGAKGISYFCYYTPRLGNYRNAPIDAWGNKTELWNSMRRVNNTIRCLAPTYNQLESKAVYHIQDGERMLREDAPSDDSLITGIDNSEASRGIAIGEYTHRQTGDTYIMVMNKNLKRSISYEQLQWRRNPAKLEIVSPYTPGEMLPTGPERQWLAPGHSALLHIIWD